MPHMLPDPGQTERFRRAFDDGGPGWALGWMHSWAIRTSREHAAACQVDGCVTCDAFIEALSLVAAVALGMPQTPRLRAALADLNQDQG